MTAVLTPEERGELAWWAFEARSERLDLKDSAVVELLGKYDPATIRKAETHDRNMSRPIWRAIVPLYQRIAAERGLTLRPPPQYPGKGAPQGPADISALVSILTDLVEEMRLSRKEQARWNKGVEETLAAVKEGLGLEAPKGDQALQPLAGAPR